MTLSYRLKFLSLDQINAIVGSVNRILSSANVDVRDFMMISDYGNDISASVHRNLKYEDLLATLKTLSMSEKKNIEIEQVLRAAKTLTDTLACKRFTHPSYKMYISF